MTFDPGSTESVAARTGVIQPDDKPYVAYQYDDDGTIALHVSIALATGRPLLLSGPPGAGKSTLARDVALCLGRRYYERVITSRTQARDLLWQFDAVGRLADAQGNREWVYRPSRFVEPDVLWWAMAPGLAQVRGEELNGFDPPPAPNDPYWRFRRGNTELALGPGAVVLLDEIDKADPDVPNDLLVPVGDRRFTVDETGAPIKAETGRDCLVFITTNGERDLPPAFLRRCITLDLLVPRGDVMKQIVKRHVPALTPKLLDRLIARHQAMVDAIGTTGRPPGTAELIDGARAAADVLARYKPSKRDSVFERLLAATVWKRAEPMPLVAERPAAQPSAAESRA
jgi:MoxR-like ATPase